MEIMTEFLESEKVRLKQWQIGDRVLEKGEREREREHLRPENHHTHMAALRPKLSKENFFFFLSLLF